MHPWLLAEVRRDDLAARYKAGEQHRQAALVKQGSDRLGWAVGTDGRGPVHKMACYILCGLGHQLVAFGRRLEGLEAPRLPQPISSREAGAATPRHS
jgi:hypothetical protein